MANKNKLIKSFGDLLDDERRQLLKEIKRIKKDDEYKEGYSASRLIDVIEELKEANGICNYYVKYEIEKNSNYNKINNAKKEEFLRVCKDVLNWYGKQGDEENENSSLKKNFKTLFGRSAEAMLLDSQDDVVGDLEIVEVKKAVLFALKYSGYKAMMDRMRHTDQQSISNILLKFLLESYPNKMKYIMEDYFPDDYIDQQLDFNTQNFEENDGQNELNINSIFAKLNEPSKIREVLCRHFDDIETKYAYFPFKSDRYSITKIYIAIVERTLSNVQFETQKNNKKTCAGVIKESEIKAKNGMGIKINTDDEPTRTENERFTTLYVVLFEGEKFKSTPSISQLLSDITDNWAKSKKHDMEYLAKGYSVFIDMYSAEREFELRCDAAREEIEILEILKSDNSNEQTKSIFARISKAENKKKSN